MTDAIPVLKCFFNGRKYTCMAYKQFFNEILSHSTSKTWGEAKKEWIPKDSYDAEEFQTCICGHYPIKNIHIIQNQSNGASLEIGNQCVKKFFDPEIVSMIKSLQKIKKDITKSVSVDMLYFLINKKAINQWEFDFYENIRRKRKLSEKQLDKKLKLNERIIRLFV